MCMKVPVRLYIYMYLYRDFDKTKIYMPVDEPESPVKSSELLSVTSYEGITVILPCNATGDTK